MTTGPAPVRRPPSATRGRYLLLIVVLLLGGASAGQITHHLVLGSDWLAVTSACYRQAAAVIPDPAAALDRVPLIRRCLAPVEHRLALFGVGGALLVLAAAALPARVLPRVLLRRLGARRAAPAPMAERAAAIAAELGVRRAPAVEIGSWRLREPFTVRVGRRTRIVLPPGARRLPPDSLDAVLRHETAHIAAGDVRLVWLTRGLLWVLPFLLAVPVVVAASAGGIGDVPFWLEYGTRAAVLWSGGYLLTRGVMRDREHEADLHAAAAGSGPALEALLGAAPSASAGPEAARSGPGAVRRLVAMHPGRGRRVAVLREPGRLAGMPGVIAAVAGLLAVGVWDHGNQIALSGLAATPLQVWPSFLAGLLAGGLLAASWGLAHWRRWAGPPRAATAGLALGAVVGLRLGMNPARMVTGGGLGDWPELVSVPLLVAGAAGILLALAAAAGGVPGGPREGAARWPVAVAFGTVAFAGAFGIGQALGGQRQLLAAVEVSPWPPGALLLTGFNREWVYYAAGTLVVLAGAVAAALGGRRAGAVAAGGLVVGLGAVAARWLVPYAPVEEYPAAQYDWWAAAAAGFAVTLVLLLRRGARGLGDALLAGPVAAVTVSVAVLLRYLPDWDDPLAAARVYLSRPLSMLALLILLAGMLAGLLPSRAAPAGRRWWRAPAAAVLLAAAIIAAVPLSGDAFLGP